MPQATVSSEWTSSSAVIGRVDAPDGLSWRTRPGRRCWHGPRVPVAPFDNGAHDEQSAPVEPGPVRQQPVPLARAAGCRRLRHGARHRCHLRRSRSVAAPVSVSTIRPSTSCTNRAGRPPAGSAISYSTSTRRTASDGGARSQSSLSAVQQPSAHLEWAAPSGMQTPTSELGSRTSPTAWASTSGTTRETSRCAPRFGSAFVQPTALRAPLPESVSCDHDHTPAERPSVAPPVRAMSSALTRRPMSR
jgi:hypothetical protein